jgi:thiosulfate/3-mercaptopyruvate sulfurtransferase
MRITLSLLVGGMLVAMAATAASLVDFPRAQLWTFVDLQTRLDDPNLRLIDARSKSAYDRGHIPGAVWVNPAALETMAGKPGALTDRDLWADWIKPLGIGPETTVLVYDGNRQLDAARVWWLLTYLGVPRAGLLDGGFTLWSKQDRPITTDVPEIAPIAFPIALQETRHAARKEVLAAVEAKSARVVDARSTGEYTGAVAKSKRGGRIPTACHLEWNTLVQPDGTFLPEPDLRAKVAAAGIGPTGETVITHCQGGGRGSVDAFILERLGYQARNYYESWADWGNADDTPIETGQPN